jgi:hypothetical protein
MSPQSTAALSLLREEVMSLLESAIAWIRHAVTSSCRSSTNEAIVCLATVIAAAESFLVGEDDPMLDAVRSSLP